MKKRLLSIVICCIAIFIADTVKAQIITTVVGTGGTGLTADGLQATVSDVFGPNAVCFDDAGNLYYCDANNNRVRKVNAAGVVTTIAGTGTLGSIGDGGPATAAEFNDPGEVLVDHAGNIYISDLMNNKVRKINTLGIITTIAGTGSAGYDGDGAAATARMLWHPYGLSFDSHGNLYISDQLNSRIRMVNTSGIITTVAGTGTAGFLDNIAATAALLRNPTSIYIDYSDNLLICDNGNHRIRKVNTSGFITTIVGTGTPGYIGDGMAATATEIQYPSGIKLDALNNLYIADAGNSRVRKVNAAGIVSTLTGTITPGFSGDGFAATAAEINEPLDVAIDGYGNIFFSDYNNNRVRRISSGNRRPDFINGGDQTITMCENTIDSINSLLTINDSDVDQTETWSLFVPPLHGTVYTGSLSGVSYSATSTGSTITPTGIYYVPYTGFAGNDSFKVWIGDGFSVDSTTIHVTVSPLPDMSPITGPSIVCPGGTITLSDASSGGTWHSANTSIATVSSGTVTAGTTAGSVVISYTRTNTCGTIAARAVVMVGNPYIETIAGNGTSGSIGDGSAATAAEVSSPTHTVMDASGNLYVTDFGSNKIRKISSAGIITTIAGTGTAGHVGDGTAATGAQLNGPSGIARDAAGNIYFTEYAGSYVRKINTSGIVSTLCGTGTAGASSVDGTVATASAVSNPWGVAVDAIGNVYFSDRYNNNVRIINTAGLLGTFAGNGTAGFTGDTGPATTAELHEPLEIVFDMNKNAYISDAANNRVRKVSAAGIITTIAGNGTGSYSGDNIAATTAEINTPAGVAIDSAGNIYIGEYLGDRVRKVNTSGIITTVAGTGTAGYNGDHILATTAQVHNVQGVSVYGVNTIIICDGLGNRVREIYPLAQGVSPVLGSSTLCVGGTLPLTDTAAGGTWSSSSSSVGSVGSATGIVVGNASGTTLITDNVTYQCGVMSASKSVTVTALSPITPLSSSVCIGAADTLTDTAHGGVWVTTATDITLGSANGVVTGISVGTASVSYTVGSCFAIATVTVNANPAAISPSTGTVCTGSSLLYTDGTGSGTWSITNIHAGISGGLVTGSTAGFDTIKYTVAGCSAMATVSVVALAAVSPVTSSICVGATVALTDATTGGIWSASNTHAGVSGGTVTGSSPGLDTIIYTIFSGASPLCSSTATVSVNTTPSALSSTNFALCTGTTATLTDGVTGGSWSASNGHVTVVGGLVTGMTIGIDTITYAIGSCSVISIVTVNSAPGAISPATAAVCVGSNVTLTDLPSGGVWSATPITGSATVVSGTVTGVSAGTVTISYSIGTCLSTAAITVNALPSAITPSGVSICTGSTVLLTDAGGTWSSSASGTASVNSASGLVTGTGTGTAIISFTNSNGCSVSEIVTVNTAPGAISPSTASICVGKSTTYTDLPAGGTWSATAITGSATVLSGTATGVSAGTVTISYSIGSCVSTALLTVNALPSAISPTGGVSICAGTTTTLTDAGGTWSSSASGTAAVNSTTGVVTGAGVGTATISFTNSNGCYVTEPVTVNTAPAAITPATTGVCVGSTVTLHETATGGAWSSGSTGTATVGSTGIVTGGTTTGVATISYSIGSCIATAIVTVNALPSAISPSTPVSVCVATTTTLSDAGGVWSSSNSHASVGSTGIVTGNTAGVDTIIYSNGAGCAVTKTVTVILTPGAITPLPTSVCLGSTITLSETTGGGIWSSSSTNATIGSTGVGTVSVLGSSTGTATISYSVGTCYAIGTLSVNPVPSGITPSTAVSVCVGSTTTLSDAGGTWSSTAGGIASINSTTGVVTGVSGGTATISYTNAFGCAATKVITVNIIPVGGTITGPANVCSGTINNYTESVSGGVWTVTNSHASINSAGQLTGISIGTDTIKYTITTSCGTASASKIVIVGAFLTAGTITGSNTVCAGSTTPLIDLAPAGVWSNTSGHATVGTSGVVTGVLAGVDTINYTVTGACGSTAATHTITINPLPVAGIISGATSICVGATSAYTDTITGGTWTLSNSHASVTSGGVVTPLSAGTDTLKYTASNGCGSASTTLILTINPALTAGTITGGSAVCMGSSLTLADGTTGGTWSSSNGTATVTLGTVAPVTPGIDTISYSVTNVCGTAIATKTVTVNALPNAGAISGSAAVCVGATSTYTNTVTGGAWSMSNSHATISGSGVLTPVSAGTDTIIYTYTNPCGTATTTQIITIGAAVSAGTISGPSTLCTGTSGSLTDGVSGGTWSASNSTVSVGTSGALTALAVGVDTISYTVTTSCGTATATQTVTVNLTASAGTITGPGSICTGSTTTYTDGTTGGVWSMSNGKASISSTGIVTPVTAGIDTISYTVTNSCGTATATQIITIGATVSAGTITGSSTMCTGTTASFTDGVTGGTWSASNTNASVGTAGMVTALAIGVDTISYTVTTGCGTAVAIQTVTVSLTASAGTISGAGSICLGSTTAYTDGTTGGVWSMSNGSATIGSTGILTPVTTGIDTVIYTVTNSCGTATATQVITIGTSVSAGTITGTSGICIGSTVTLTDGASGGTWSVSNAHASVTSSGAVTGLSAGTDVVSYTVTTGCGTATAVKTVTVSIAPVAGTVVGPAVMCDGTFTLYTDTASGGVWSLSNGLASITTTGVVTSSGLGLDTVIYTVTNACGSVTASKGITISATLTAGTITGTGTLCTGGSAALSDGASGGVWSSSATGVGTISTGGIVTAIAPGTTRISYTVTSGCGTAVATMNVVVSIAPVAGVVLGPAIVCAGTFTLFTDTATGGVWSMSNGLATITLAGVVTTVASGLDTVIYTVTNSCGSVAASKALTISTLLTAGSITGGGTICPGGTLALSDGVSGGTWSSSNTSAVINTSGIVTGLVPGMDTISYTVVAGCGTAVATTVVTVGGAADAGIVSGPDSVCLGSTILLSDGVGGGSWSAGNTNATVSSSGVVTGLSSGTTPISYAVSGGCGAGYAVKVITITTFPVSGTISGSSSVCVGSGITLTASAPGGGWYSSNSNAFVASPGIIDGVTVGIDTIFYTVTNACGTSVSSKPLNVDPLPVVLPATGPGSQCLGTSVTVSDGTSGGIWTSSDPLVATVDITGGSVTGVASGVTTITYTVTNVYGCPATVTITDTVITAPLPVLPSITGPLNVCIGSSVTLADTVSGGTWTSADPSVATIVSGTGVLTGASSGTATINYTVTNVCGSGTASTVETVSAPPVVDPITGTLHQCAGTTTTLGDATTGGIWSSGNTTIATIGSISGTVTGITAGTTSMNYTYTGLSGCSVTLSVTDTVIASPTVTDITGTTNECVGSVTLLSDGISGGTWISTTPSVATVSSTGTVTGVTAGTASILYTITNGAGCTTSASVIDTVNEIPVATPITGVMNVCPGSITPLFNASAGGAWSTADPSVATIISSTGVATGITTGTTKVYYTVSNSCGAVVTDSSVLTVNSLPSAGAITALFTNVCQGSSVHLTESVTGGTWSSSDGTIATAGSTGIVTGISAGTADINYTVTNLSGCSNTASIAITVGSSLVSASVSPANATVCHNHAVTMLVSASGTGLTYQWLHSGTAITGATSNMFTTTATGSYSVVVSNGSCSETLTGTTVSAPPVAVINYTAPDELHTTTFTSYQWYKNGVAIAGANSNLIHETGAGRYTVAVTDGNGCTDTSAVYTITSSTGHTGISSINGNDDISIYPNPATQYLHIAAPVAVSVKVLSMDGRTMIGLHTTNDIDVSNLPDGVYMVQVYDEENILLRTARFTKAQ